VVFHYLVNDFDVNEHWINYSRYNLWSGMKSRILWTWPRGRHVKDWPLCFEEFILLLFDIIHTYTVLLLFRCMRTCVQYIETEKKKEKKDWLNFMSERVTIILIWKNVFIKFLVYLYTYAIHLPTIMYVTFNNIIILSLDIFFDSLVQMPRRNMSAVNK
jgi:hypothetical protein